MTQKADRLEELVTSLEQAIEATGVEKPASISACGEYWEAVRTDLVVRSICGTIIAHLEEHYSVDDTVAAIFMIAKERNISFHIFRGSEGFLAFAKRMRPAVRATV